MGVCLSRCGDAQHKAGVVAATISHQNSLEGIHGKNDSASDPNHSLKTFLQLYESKRSFSSPRASASLGDALHIPHSSELFSLPDSDASTPARTSRASISSSPGAKSNRNSFSAWGNGHRFSTDKTISMGCRKKLRRTVEGTGHDHDHQRLVEAIARLERLNNGKNLELRGSSFCRSDLDHHSRQHCHLTKSRSGGIRPGRNGTHSSRREYFQDESMGNLVSVAGPIIKQRPLEKSVTNFLKEVEDFVPLIEAPRLSLSSEVPMNRKEDGPLIITTYRRAEEDGAEDTDEEQFTFFEASFDCCRKSHEPAAAPIADEEALNIPCKLPAEEPESDSTAKPSTASPIDQKEPTLSIYEDPGIIEEKRTPGKADAVRPVLADVSMNIVVTPKRSPIVSKAKAHPTRLRRGLSRSLDSRDQGSTSTTKVDFTVFRTKVAPIAAAAAQGLNEGKAGDQEKLSEGEITH